MRRDAPMQRRLIVFEGEHMIGSARHDPGRARRLAAQRVDGDDATGKRQGLQQRRNRGELVGFAVHGDLPQHQPVRAGPGADQMQRSRALGPVMAAAPRLAVEGDHLLVRRGRQSPPPAEQRGLEGDRIERGEDAAEGVVGGNAIGQGEKGAPPVRLGAAEALGIDPCRRRRAPRITPS